MHWWQLTKSSLIDLIVRAVLQIEMPRISETHSACVVKSSDLAVETMLTYAGRGGTSIGYGMGVINSGWNTLITWNSRSDIMRFWWSSTVRASLQKPYATIPATLSINFRYETLNDGPDADPAQAQAFHKLFMTTDCFFSMHAFSKDGGVSVCHSKDMNGNRNLRNRAVGLARRELGVSPYNNSSCCLGNSDAFISHFPLRYRLNHLPLDDNILLTRLIFKGA